MAVLVVGSRPPAYSRAMSRLGVEYDAVYDPQERPRTQEFAPRQVFWRPYITEPESVLSVPGLSSYEGVVTFTDFGSLPSALLTTAFDLPGPSVAAVLRTRNKYVMRTALREQGLPQPAFGIIGQDEPAPDDFPLIAKPLDGTGSSGVRFVPSPGALCAVPPGRMMMWESHVSGPQYTVEGISDKSGYTALAVTGKSLSGPPHFVVLEHETPAPLDSSTREVLTTYAEDCLTTLGVADVATHTEIVVRDDGNPMLIETHTRPAGDLVPYITLLTTGWDQCELALSAALAHRPKVEPHLITAPFARTLHFTPYDSFAMHLIDPQWLSDFPEVRSHDFSRVTSPITSDHESKWGRDPRWGRVVIAGSERAALEKVSLAIRARALGSPASS